ncbi:MFS transporter, partial [Nocardiopsis sp. RV163]|uniref:MFS transporter n=1 Tax=Nocardiopsis sp. RV163 TaxID=1661388 RepID=UPI00064BE672
MGWASWQSTGAVLLGSALLPFPLLNRWGVRRALFAGTAGAGLTAVLFAAAVAADSYRAMLPAVVLLGVTAGTAYPIVFAAAGAAVDDGEQGVGSSAVSTSQQIGGAVGLAALVAVADAASGAGAAGLGAAALAFRLLDQRVEQDLQEEVDLPPTYYELLVP